MLYTTLEYKYNVPLKTGGHVVLFVWMATRTSIRNSCPDLDGASMQIDCKEITVSQIIGHIETKNHTILKYEKFCDNVNLLLCGRPTCHSQSEK